ncbi:LysR family transcriptional regulator [Litoribacillus peritrichatus]|uniref:Transcriptional regulator GcvA n=1 Tax=Litoribacillus peritrichatus TaxID=718191 RepID=A0ABP7NC59_9GAMM
MTTQLPPLQSLRAFLIAADHESFKLAANELHLTPSAVSHQIKGLEELLGIDLFRRHNRQIKLTPAGQMYQSVVEKALNDLNLGTDKLQRHFGRNVLRARIPPMIATDFIIPKLNQFQQKHPEIELRLETCLQWTTADLGELDAMLFFGLPLNTSDTEFRKILPLSATPIMTKTYYDRYKPTMDTITSHPLIHSTIAPDGWQRYFDAFGLSYTAKSSDLWWDSYSSMLQSCCADHGITLGLKPLLSPRLESGELIAPFKEEFEITEAIYLVYRKDRHQSPAIQAFNDWVEELLAPLLKG